MITWMAMSHVDEYGSQYSISCLCM